MLHIRLADTCSSHFITHHFGVLTRGAFHKAALFTCNYCVFRSMKDKTENLWLSVVLGFQLGS